MAVPSPDSCTFLLLRPLQNSEFRSRRIVKAMSQSSTEWFSRNRSVPSGLGRNRKGTIF